jgi:hypothetical protein
MIALEAEKCSNAQLKKSPFGKSAEEAGYMYRGGKPDDITVMVSQVKVIKKNKTE